MSHKHQILAWSQMLALAALLTLAPQLALAHGGLSMEKDTCKLSIGPYAMHFTGYQPEATGTKEFCEDIPVVGHTIIALDAVDPTLRDVPLEVRIIRNTGDEHDLDAISVVHLPPKVYPTGSVSFEYNFDQAGKFVGLVSTGGSGRQYTSRFPFSVAESWGWINVYLLGGAVVVAGGLLFWYSVSFAGAAPERKAR